MAAPAFMSPDEYLAFERASETKHEYIDGVVYAMAGASQRHNRASSNILTELNNQLRDRNCDVFGSDMRIRPPSGTRFFYPDVVVACGELELLDDDNLLNPVVLVEVMSPSTASYDRITKFKHYRPIPSLRQYVLVEQAYCLAECFTRQGDGGWSVIQLDSLDDFVELSGIGCSVPLAEIYRRVELGPPPITPLPGPR